MSDLNFAKQTTGQTLNFAKDMGLDFSKTEDKLIINLNWGKDNGRSVDLDSQLTLVTAGSKGFLGFGGGNEVKSNTYYGALTAGRGDGVKHHGDDTTGAFAEGEFIEIDMKEVGDDVTAIVPGLISYSRHDMSKLPFAHLRVYLGTVSQVNTPLFEVDLTEVPSGTLGALFGKMVRNGSDWEWETKTQFTSSKSFDGLASKATKL